MISPAPGVGHLEDPLARYRRRRAQQALFDVQARGPSPGYDEFVDAAGDVRPAWEELAGVVRDRGRVGLDQLRATVRDLVDNDGITYIRVDDPDDDTGPTPVPWRLDPLPIVVSATEWDRLEAGLVQRSRLLDAVLADIYGPQRAVTDGVLPPQLLYGHPGYLRAAHGLAIPGRHQLFLHGCDVSRASSGDFLVNADWTQAPSGAGYALADRRVVAHAVPDLYEQIAPRPASPWAQALRLALIDAAPESAEEPVVVVLSPGNHSETAFDQAYLAGLLGFPLVESADLVVRDGKLWMRSMGTLERVDVVLRRVDADYADPLDLRADSRLGVVGLVEALRRGSVTVVNTLGSGILESPGVQRFLPDLAQSLLGETPLLATQPMYWCGIRAERSHVLANLTSLLIRPVTGGDVIVGPELSNARRAELEAAITAEPWQWVGQELPEFSSAPAAHTVGGLTSSTIGMRLFSVAQRGGYAPMVGGLGYVLAQGTSAYRLNSVAAKDVWVRTAARATAEKKAEVSGLPSPAISSPTREVSSPRVLSDLFWIGRYAERAEHMARLLTVTRERHHEFRYRKNADGSQCVPVLLTALAELTGEPVDTEDIPEMLATVPSTLWALTADRHRAGSLAQSIERLGLAARAVRDQMSNDIWMVLAAIERALLRAPERPPESKVEGETFLATTNNLALAGMLALSGMIAESMVRDVGWTMMDIGKRIERGLGLSALLGSALTTARTPAAEQTVIESVLVVCESLVIYRRRNPGVASVGAVAELVLFDATNPRSLVYQLEQLRADLRVLTGASGSSRLERMLDDIAARLRRTEPTDLEDVDADSRRRELAGLLAATHRDLADLAAAISATHLSLPGGMQPLWGPDRRRLLP
ncbi:circularly permuted type 2 ATP-grasp protein [Mycobacterium sp. pV006]|uniref:circularly permuted type 2 ATP-grasp protein n=1 Tax=Mycobacterium sp. pV006 TaxID=3238983 RepID=UPI00351BC5AA